VNEFIFAVYSPAKLLIIDFFFLFVSREQKVFHPSPVLLEKFAEDLDPFGWEVFPWAFGGKFFKGKVGKRVGLVEWL
jgi:hypothetical protein